jgi:hypothetical protein
MPRDLSYAIAILVLIVALFSSNDRATRHQDMEDHALRLCETATRILENRQYELAATLERVEHERNRLLGLSKPRRME